MSALESYLDRGPLGSAIGQRLGGRLPGILAVLLVATAPAAGIVDESWALIAAAVLFFLGVVLVSPDRGSLGWLVPPLLRAAEYGTVLTVLASGSEGAPWGYAYLGALAYHHYDIVYRLRNLGDAPPVWVQTALLGAEFRTPIVLIAVVAGASMDWVFAIATAIVAIPAVTESVAAWSRADAPNMNDDIDD